MRTNLPDILAAGDCVETWHRLLEAPTYLPLGTTAHKQGRIAGETAVGGDRTFAGSLGTQVVKVFELAVARTGLRDPDARQAGFDAVTVGSVQFDHKAYYPGAHQLHIRITGDRRSGRLLGAQLVGHQDAEVAKRIDIPADALFHHMSVDGLNELDLSYTPPFGSPWDAVQLAAQDWVRQTQALSPGPLLFFDLAEDWLDAVLASAYRALPSLGGRTVPAPPSTVTTWPSTTRVVASPVATTAGMPYSRATREAWAARVPPSVTTTTARATAASTPGQWPGRPAPRQVGSGRSHRAL
jgi:hypothetical protein